MRTIALLAFAFHQPGVRLLTGLRQSRRARRINVVLLVVTLLATALAGVIAPERARFELALATFLTGHFTWSACFAWLVMNRFDETFERPVR